MNSKTTSELQKLTIDFLEYCEIEKNHSELTVKNYDHYLARFLNLSDCKKPGDITLDVVRKYRLGLNRYKDEKGRGLKKVTQNYYLIALRAFLKYLAKRDIKTLAAEKIELGSQEERIIEFLELPELERLLKAPLEAKKETIINVRDKAILELLFSTGLRVSELCGLDNDSVNLDKEEFTIRGKGDKPRLVFLSKNAKYWLKKYSTLRKDKLAPLFINHTRAKTIKSGQDASRRLTPRSVERMIQKYAKIAGLTKKVTPHTMRHSYATDLLMNGADIRSVQAMLGHSSITTTQIYTHLTNQHLKEVYKAFHDKRRGNIDKIS
ncbi:tyrosine-type recombinase/integrase [Patescibacteria group bacterium]|nr:tyrosine-type recombinase/integrase [Patescibacteria group bacterium]